jgi:hypothetical protein
MIFKNYIYFIKEYSIYKTKIGTKVVEFVNNSSSPNFNFILFENYNKVIHSDSSRLFLTILYIIDVIIILIFIYLIKKKKLTKKNYEEVLTEMTVFNKK